MSKTKSKKSRKKKLARDLEKLDAADRSVLLELRPKKVKRLMRSLEKETARSEREQWKVKRKCCGKALHKMCPRCPRRILVQRARAEAGVLDRLA